MWIDYKRLEQEDFSQYEASDPPMTEEEMAELDRELEAQYGQPEMTEADNPPVEYDPNEEPF